MGLLRVFLIAALLTFAANASQAQQRPDDSYDAPLEHKVKAAYIFNFARFVQWPGTDVAPSTAPFVVGVIGHDAFTTDLTQTLGGHVIEGRPVVITQLNSVADTDRSNILVVARSEWENVGEVLKSTKEKPILTVSEMNDFLIKGGMIQMDVKENKVQFTVNMPAVKRSGLTISSQMLQYANIWNKTP